MEILIGSARVDERGTYTGGARGDQKQTEKRDLKGEVSMQPFYIHKKGWYILRAKDDKHASALAKAIRTACNNKHIGYSQSDRYSIFEYGLKTKKDANCDCSSLVRKCIIEATGKDPGDFSTLNEASCLERTGLFHRRIEYKQGIPLFNGDILVTMSKGHTVIVAGHANKRLGDKEDV